MYVPSLIATDETKWSVNPPVVEAEPEYLIILSDSAAVQTDETKWYIRPGNLRNTTSEERTQYARYQSVTDSPSR